MTDNSHQLEKINPHTGEPYSVRPNKTQLKRELKAVQEMVIELIGLAPGQLEQLPLPDSVRDAILDSRKMQKSALQRQIRYLTGVFNEDQPVDLIRQALLELKIPHQQAVQEHHEIEMWREQLLQNDNQLFNTLASEFPDFDRQYVSQLVRNAAREKKQDKPPKSSRALFKYLRDLKSSSE